MTAPGKTGLSIREEQLQALRKGDEAGKRSAIQELRQSIFLYLTRYVSSRRRGADVEELVDAALVEALPVIMNPKLSQAQVEVELGRTVNRVVKRTQRYLSRREGLSPTLAEEAITDNPEDRLISALFASEILPILRSAIGNVLQNMRDPDYALLVDSYHLEDLGLSRSPRELRFRSENARRKALYRARLHFAQALANDLKLHLKAASPKDKELYAAAAKIGEVGVDLGTLLDLLRPSSPPSRLRQEPAAPEQVSPPCLTVVWDPAVVSEQDYPALVSAIADLVRSEGGAGIQLVESASAGVPAAVGVLP